MGRARVQTAQPEEEIKEIEQQQEEIEEVEEIEEEAKELEEKAIAKQPIQYLIHTPNGSYSGLNCGVEFKQGKGYTANKVIAEMFIEKGYEVEEIK